MLLVFWGTVKREIWLYCEPWALHFLVFISLKIYFSCRHLLFLFIYFFFLSHKNYYFSSSPRPTAKIGTSITVAASNSMIFAIRLASDLIHGKRLLIGCFFSLTTRRQGCLSLLFLPGCANCFRKPITVIRKCKILPCSVNFSEFCISVTWFA